MLWPFLSAALMSGVTPVDNAASSITGYILGFGPLGVVALAMAWLFSKGWRLVSPAREAAIRNAARNDGRTDLLKELERVLTEKRHTEDQRDDALRIAQDQIVPLLVQFNATISALLPLLQNLVSRHEGP